MNHLNDLTPVYLQDHSVWILLLYWQFAAEPGSQLPNVSIKSFLFCIKRKENSILFYIKIETWYGHIKLLLRDLVNIVAEIILQ